MLSDPQISEPAPEKYSTARSTAGIAGLSVFSPAAGLAVEIAARAQTGQNRFEIRLDPPELGRIDVRLDIDSSGQVTSRLVVERADTLEHLRRDSAGRRDDADVGVADPEGDERRLRVSHRLDLGAAAQNELGKLIGAACGAVVVAHPERGGARSWGQHHGPLGRRPSALRA